MSWRRPVAHHIVRLRLLRLGNRWEGSGTSAIRLSAGAGCRLISTDD